MSSEEQFKFSQHRMRFNAGPQSLPRKLLGLILGAVLLVLGFMFSLVALAVVAVGGTLLGGWLWWKTRALRRELAKAATPGESRKNRGDDRVIEGEAVRTDEPPNATGRLLS